MAKADEKTQVVSCGCVDRGLLIVKATLQLPVLVRSGLGLVENAILPSLPVVAVFDALLSLVRMK